MTHFLWRRFGLPQIAVLVVLGVLSVGLTGCYTQLRVADSSSSASQQREVSGQHYAPQQRAVSLNWTNACYGARDGLARYYGSLCYTSVTGRPWYEWLGDRFYGLRSPWRHLMAVSEPFGPYEPPTSFADRSSRDRPMTERRAGADRAGEDRRGRGVDRSVPRDTSQRQAATSRRESGGNRVSGRTLRSQRTRPAKRERISDGLPPFSPSSPPTTIVEDQLEQVDVETMERRARHLRRSLARSMAVPERMSLDQSEARLLLRRLARQSGSGALSSPEQAQVLSSLRQIEGKSGLPPLKASDLPEGMDEPYRSGDYDASNTDVNWSKIRRAAEQHQRNWTDPQPNRAGRMDVERAPPNASRPTPAPTASTTEESGNH